MRQLQSEGVCERATIPKAHPRRLRPTARKPPRVLLQHTIKRENRRGRLRTFIVPLLCRCWIFRAWICVKQRTVRLVDEVRIPSFAKRTRTVAGVKIDDSRKNSPRERGRNYSQSIVYSSCCQHGRCGVERINQAQQRSVESSIDGRRRPS